LAHYKAEIDRLTILDNSSGEFSVQVVLENGEIINQEKELCSWVRSIVLGEGQKKETERPGSIEEARKLYKEKNKPGHGSGL
jgi:hypothetical protein